MLESEDKPFLTFLSTVVLNCMYTKEENFDQRWTTFNLQSMDTWRELRHVHCWLVEVSSWISFCRQGSELSSDFSNCLKNMRYLKERAANHWDRWQRKSFPDRFLRIRRLVICILGLKTFILSLWSFLSVIIVLWFCKRTFLLVGGTGWSIWGHTVMMSVIYTRSFSKEAYASINRERLR